MARTDYGVKPMAWRTAPGHRDRRAAAIASVADWVNSEPMRRLVAAFGEPWPASSLVDLLERLEEVSARHWDFRGGNSERWEADTPDFPPELVEMIYQSGDRLGLVRESQPIDRSYDAVAVLGGGRQTPRVRARYLADLVGRGAIASDRIYLLGSPRELKESERQFTDAYAFGATTEFDLMNAAGAEAFSLSSYDEEGGSVGDERHPYAQWRVRRYHRVGPEQITSISAPTSDLSRRPNTGDTYQWLVRHGEFSAGDHLLLVTSAWFTAFQGFDAMQLLDLPHGLDTEIIGFGVERVPEHLSPTVILQEVRSGIRSARNLYLAAVGEN